MSRGRLVAILAAVAALGLVAIAFAWTRYRSETSARPAASVEHRAARPLRDIDVFDVAARMRAKAATYKRGQNQKDMYFQGTGGTAHLHLIKPGQIIPLHIHEHTVEATVPVIGRPIVTQVFPSDGGVETKKDRYDEGTLIVSPQNCAHEWQNALTDEYHGSLVFTLGASFRGNLFVDAGDPRILTSSPPTILDPGARFDAFVASEQPFERIDIPVAKGAVAAVFTKRTFAVSAPTPPTPESPTLVYVIKGLGRIEGTASPIDLHPTVLVVMRRAPDAQVIPDAANPLALYVVRIPEGPESLDQR
jgi:hypothetical protein